MRILIAEDERDLNHIVSAKLSESGYSVDSCYDGEEAMDFLSAAGYDVVILDIMMPIVWTAVMTEKKPWTIFRRPDMMLSFWIL